MNISMMLRLLAVFLGSGLGGVCRWLISQSCVATWPVGTFLVNVLGCFLFGLLSRLMPGGEVGKVLLVTGFCGGFTTFSTFVNENLMMLRSGQLLTLVLYAGASLVLGLLAAALGYRCL